MFFICKQELLDRLCCILYNIINPIIGDDTVNNTEITTSAVAAWRAAVCAVLAIVLMIIAQLAAFFIGSLPAAIGLPQAVGNVISAILYPLLALISLKLLCGAFLGVKLADCRITGYKIKPVWTAAAFIMPIIVVGGLLMTAGHWENPALDSMQISALVTQSVFLVGLAVGTVEEAVFRGVIMKALEMRWGKGVAVIVPSVLFAAAHVLNGKLSLASSIQLLAAGSVVGILFSLVTYESGSIWPAALMHSVWNIFMASGILNISDEAMENCIFNYVLETKSPLITGGEFGAEASVVSIGAYLIFIALAAVLLKKKSERSEKI